ncbi:MAG: hypothetical protein GX801_12015, partial [Fibrobacter sp.]|nr:hypothetical protein [Fibrobacter sp.]
MKRQFLLIIMSLMVLSIFVACGPDYKLQYNLHVQVQGEGSVYPNQGVYKANELIAFRIEPRAGWAFSHWEGRDGQLVVNNGNRYEVLMDRDVYLIAVFSDSSSGTKYNLSVKVQGNGSVYPNSGQYDSGTTVNLNVTPSTGWTFSNWEGPNRWDVESDGSSWKLKMDGHKDLTAVFIQGQGGSYNLDVKILGRGEVSQIKISDADSQEQYPGGTEVLLTANAAPGWTFKEWRGDASGTFLITKVLMDRNKSVTAVFEEGQKELTVKVIGQGSVEEKLMGDAEIDGSYPSNSIVRLLAKPASGWTFQEWMGDARGTEPVVTIEMDTNKTVTAVFAQANKVLDITIQGKGKVEQKVISASEEYPAGSAVRLWAKPDNGWTFKEWRGDARGKDTIIYVDMDEDKKITAVFEQSNFTLDIEIVGKGRVDERQISQDIADYPMDSIVRLTARPDSGWVFKEWRGDARGTKNVIEIEMDDDKYVTAVFEEEAEARYTLDDTVSGNGRVTKSPDSRDYEEGTEVTLKATADSGWRFKEWR